MGYRFFDKPHFFNLAQLALVRISASNQVKSSLKYSEYRIQVLKVDDASEIGIQS